MGKYKLRVFSLSVVLFFILPLIYTQLSFSTSLGELFTRGEMLREAEERELEQDAKEFESLTTKSPTSANVRMYEKIIDFLGKPYRLGAEGKDSDNAYDCSAFTQSLFSLRERNSRQQYSGESSYKVNLLDIKEGDLVFFDTRDNIKTPTYISHVGVYVGEGYFVHASQVRNRIELCHFNSYGGYYINRLISVKRVKEEIISEVFN